MKTTIPKTELLSAFEHVVKAIRGYKAKSISPGKAFELIVTALTTKPVKIVHIRRCPTTPSPVRSR
jgi:hypothetical protein